MYRNLSTISDTVYRAMYMKKWKPRRMYMNVYECISSNVYECMNVYALYMNCICDMCMYMVYDICDVYMHYAPNTKANRGNGYRSVQVGESPLNTKLKPTSCLSRALRHPRRSRSTEAGRSQQRHPRRFCPKCWARKQLHGHLAKLRRLVFLADGAMLPTTS